MGNHVSHVSFSASIRSTIACRSATVFGSSPRRHSIMPCCYRSPTRLSASYANHFPVAIELIVAPRIRTDPSWQVDFVFSAEGNITLGVPATAGGPVRFPFPACIQPHETAAARPRRSPQPLASQPRTRHGRPKEPHFHPPRAIKHPSATQ